MRSGEMNKRDGRRVTVRLSEAEAKRLDAISAPTTNRGALESAAVLRAGLAMLPAPGFDADGEAVVALLGDDASAGPCKRVHLDELTAHKLLVELGREGRSVNMIAAKINSLAKGLVEEGETFDLDDVMVRLDALDERILDLRAALGASDA